MRRPMLALTLVLAASCSDRTPIMPDVSAPTASIWDAAHEGGNAHFHFLPPLAAAPVATAAFDGSLLLHLTVQVCSLLGGACVAPPLAVFTARTGTGGEVLRISPEDELYIVNWRTDGLESGARYRIRVLAAGTELGHADVDVVGTGAGLKNVDTDEYVGLVAGRTLPIKFRIEVGAVFVVGPAGGTIQAGGGRVTLRIPENALPTDVGITVKQGGAASSDEGTIPGTLWEFGPDGTEFHIPAALTMVYAPDALPPTLSDPASSLVLVTLESAGWVESPTTLDPNVPSVTGPIQGFSVKAVAKRTGSVDVAPSATVLDPGQVATIGAIARNANGAALLRRALSWSTANAGIAHVDQAGIVTAVSPGVVQVTVTPRIQPAGVDPCSLGYPLCLFPFTTVSVTVSSPLGAFHGDFVGTLTPDFSRVCIVPVANCSPPNTAGASHATLHLEQSGDRVRGQIDSRDLGINGVFLVGGTVTSAGLMFRLNAVQLFGNFSPLPACPGSATFADGVHLIGSATCVVVTPIDTTFQRYVFVMSRLQ